MKTKTMNKAYVFTVSCADSGKPIKYCQTASDYYVNNQSAAEDLIASWAENEWGDDPNTKYDSDMLKSELEDLTYNMRKEGYAWFDMRWCFELTPVCG